MDGFGYGNRNPVMTQGAIDTKVLLDQDLIETMRANASNTAVNTGCYPDGAHPLVHNAMQGDTWLIPRGSRVGDDADGTMLHMQKGIVAVNGLYYMQHYSQSELESSFSWGGINQNNQTVNDPATGRGNANNSQGSASYVVVKTTIPWRSDRPGYHGDLIQWGLPEMCNATADHTGPYVPGSAPRVLGCVYRPYDPADLSTEAAGGFAAMQMPKGNNGIMDMTYAESLPMDGGPHGAKSRAYSVQQEMGIALKYGIWGAALAVMDVLQQSGVQILDQSGNKLTMDALAANVGLWDTTGSQIVQDGVAAVLLDNISPLDPARRTAVRQFEGVMSASMGSQMRLQDARELTPDDPTRNYWHLRANLCATFLGGIASGLEEKRSKVVGMLLEDAEPGQDAAAIFGLHCK